MTDSSRKGWLGALDAAPQRADILLVDDDPNFRAAVSRLVTRLGHQVATAGSAEEADMHLAQRKFDLCLLDVQLPRMCGIEYLSWSLSRDPFMAVIMMTGVDDASVARECMDKGARTYLVKPVTEPFLSLAIRDALAMRQLLVAADRARSEASF